MTVDPSGEATQLMIDLLVKAGAVLTLDDVDTVFSPGAVAVDAGRVVDAGPLRRLQEQHRARTTLDRPGSVVLPGWVNTHTHLAMQLFRGLADDLSLEQFLDRLVRAEIELLDEQTARLGVRAGIAEAMRGGTTTALDMYWFPRAARDVAREAGFRLLNGPTFAGDSDPEGHDFNAWLLDAEELLATMRAQEPDTPRWLMPHSAYTLSADQLKRIAALAARFDARLHVHAAESPGESSAVWSRHQASPIKVLDRTGLLGPQTLIAHGVQLGREDIALIAERGSRIAHCPVSNLKLGCGTAPITLLHRLGVPVSVGTDGAASCGALDMLDNIRLAALLAKGRDADPTALSARDVVRMGTIEGALALGLDDVGALMPGMRADLQVVSIDTLHATPSTAYSALVYGARADDVTDLVIDGRLVLHDGQLLTIDEQPVRDALRHSAEGIASSVSRRP